MIPTTNAKIIDDWNKIHPEKKIATTGGISFSGSKITITYDLLAGDVPAIDNKNTNGIDFTGSIEKINTLDPLYKQRKGL